MEKNAILAIVLSVVVLLVWQIFFVAPLQQQKLEEERARQEELAQQQSEGPDGSVVVPQESTPLPLSGDTALPSYDASQKEVDPDAPKVVVDTPLYDITFTTHGGRLWAWQLDAHKNTNSEPVDLVSEDARRIGLLPLEVFTGDPELDRELNQGRYTSSINTLTLTEQDESQTVSLSYTTDSGIRFVKRLTFFPDTYKIYAAFQFENAGDIATSLVVAWGPGLGTDLGLAARFEPQIVSKTTDKAKPIRDQVKKIEGLTTRPNVTWAAINRKYFTAAFFPESVSNSLSMNMIAIPAEGEDKIEPIRKLIVGISQPLQSGQCQLSIYAGPKEYAKLTEAFPGFESLIDYGMFWFIAKPLAAFITFLYGYVHNYGLVIICLTILIKIIFYPLTHKSYQSMQRMQDIQPKMKVIQEKYKDKQQQQQEMMKLYKEEGVNPMGGCFPMLLQIPVFFALYQTLLQSIELRGAPFLWISDLSAPEPAFLGFLKPLVLLMGASMFLQQSLTPTTTDNRQAQMFKFMPILFTAMFWNFPSGLVLYWFMNNILTIGQQYLIKKGGGKSSKAKEPKKTQQSSSSRKRRNKGK